MLINLFIAWVILGALSVICILSFDTLSKSEIGCFAFVIWAAGFLLCVAWVIVSVAIVLNLFQLGMPVL